MAAPILEKAAARNGQCAVPSVASSFFKDARSKETWELIGVTHRQSRAEETWELVPDDVDDEGLFLDDESFTPRDYNQTSCWRFVEAGRFQVVSACVIIANTVFMFMEESDDTWVPVFFWPDQATLFFYVFELVCRMSFYRRLFCCGPKTLVFWNSLDVLVVSAGIFDQWVLPFMRVGKNSPINSVIMMLRMLRLLRIVKIIRVLLDTDLSWTDAPRFQSFIGGVIAFNALLMGFETDVKWWAWFYIEQVLLIIYVFELIVRLKRFGTYFMSFNNPDITWNLLDFIIVASSAADSWFVPMAKILAHSGKGKKKGMDLSQIMMLMRMLRLMRILRLVKLVKSVRPLYILVTGVVAAFQGVFWVLVLTIVTLYAVAILSTRLLGHGLVFPPGTPLPKSVVIFKTVPDSMFTLFRFMSSAQSDEEAAAIDELMETLPVVKFAFIFFMVTSSWTLLSILTAVVSENMINTTDEQNEEMRITSDDDDRAEHREDLNDLFSHLTKHEDGTVKHEDLVELFCDKEYRDTAARRCHVSARTALGVLDILLLPGVCVHLDTFIESMVDACNPVTEQSILKFECHLTEGRSKFQAHREVLSGKLEELKLPPRCSNGSQNGSGGSTLDNLSPFDVLQHLALQQVGSSDGIGKLHECVQALLKSQESLLMENAFASEHISRMEANFAALDERSAHTFSQLNEQLQDIRTLIRGDDASPVRPRAVGHTFGRQDQTTSDRLPLSPGSSPSRHSQLPNLRLDSVLSSPGADGSQLPMWPRTGDMVNSSDDEGEDNSESAELAPLPPFDARLPGEATRAYLASQACR